jgi:hypothetical protein
MYKLWACVDGLIWAYLLSYVLWNCLAKLIKTPYDIFYEFVLAYFYKFSKIAYENSLYSIYKNNLS